MSAAPIQHMAIDGKAFVDSFKAAELLDISERHFRALVAKEDLPRPRKFGAVRRWSVGELLAAAEKLR